MHLLGFMALSGVLLFIAYRVIGTRLARMFRLDPDAVTPAHAQRDGLDFEPARTSVLLPQHFSAIAAAGPVVGPIAAGLFFGWGPAWLWILLGSIFIGGIHDFTALMASIRHKGRSVAEIVRQYMNPRAYVLFLLFVWSALVYVIIAFADVTASTFASVTIGAGGAASGPAVASSSIMYLGLAVVMGFAQRYWKVKPVAAKFVFLPLVFLAIYLGPQLPLDLSSFFPETLNTPGGVAKVWGFALLGYCLLAAMAPVWSLLQPRGELGGYFLYIVMILGVGGILVGAFTGAIQIQQPFFKGWNAPDALGAFGGTTPVFPILFITVACGACSGFHSIVSSGTTSKQLDRETDARPIAYGGMLLEGFFACLALATLMVFVTGPGKSGSPDNIFAFGISEFGRSLLGPLGTEALSALLFQFALLCFATFVFDTLDACTRLARYILMELAGWNHRGHAWLATGISLALPIVAIALPPLEIGGKAQPLWKVFWNIFGSSNQLLAALTLLSVSVWMARKRMNYWIALLPTIFMMVMTLWSLYLMAMPHIRLYGQWSTLETIRHFQFAIVVSLLALTFWLILEALITWRAIYLERQETSAELATAT